jgi:hypothetical protein
MGTGPDSRDSEKITCHICRKQVDYDCDWQQGRCPHREPMLTIPSWRVIIYLIAAPFIIGIWCILNPQKVWQQAKKDWKL